jgi:hypothetical protein
VRDKHVYLHAFILSACASASCACMEQVYACARGYKSEDYTVPPEQLLNVDPLTVNAPVLVKPPPMTPAAHCSKVTASREIVDST